MVEEIHLAQQRHLADHGGGDPGVRRVPADVELLHRQKAPFPAQLPSFIHQPVRALPDHCQELVAQRNRADIHGSRRQNKPELLQYRI